jgi:HD-GYP domain-containing protein (c-di-GMP phosphodiesterase class II)
MKTFAAPVQQDVLRLEERHLPDTLAMARSVVSLIGFRDHYTSSHSARVANYARAIAGEMGLGEEEIETIGFAALLHDIGKMGIPDHILLKPDKLSEEELAWIQRYPEWGWMTLRHVDGFQKAAVIVLHQHEHLDGSGYPNQLKGEEIPLGSRIITVAETYDALTTDRPYRTALGHAEALAEIMRCSGVQFDPTVVKAFQAVLERG